MDCLHSNNNICYSGNCASGVFYEGGVKTTRGSGWHHTEETKKKLSQSLKGRDSPWLRLRVGNKHPLFGKHPSEETRRKLSAASKGRISPNRGKPHYISPETKKKISEALKGKYTGSKSSFYGKHHTPDVCKRISMARKGKTMSNETKEKLKHTFFKKGHVPQTKGKSPSLEVRQKIRNTLKGKCAGEKHPMFGKHHTPEALAKMKHTFIPKGNTPWNKGKTNVYSEEILKRMSESKKGKSYHTEEFKRKMGDRWRGERNPFWTGGIKEPYSTDWNETLKRSIRERDKYVCQLCSKLQTKIAFSVHHADYNKKNCNPENLITLCKQCHLKTNVDRPYWTKYFKGRMGI